MPVKKRLDLNINTTLPKGVRLDGLKKEIEEFYNNAAGTFADDARYTSELEALIEKRVYSFFNEKCRNLIQGRYNFWVNESGDDYFDKIDAVRKDFNDTYGGEEIGLMSMSTRYSLLHGKGKIVGVIGFLQNTAEKVIRFIGEPEYFDKLVTVAQRHLPERMPLFINRLTVKRSDVDSQVKLIKDKKPISDPKLFWPYFDKTPAELAKEFDESDANVLLVYGSPGLGKSQFIREILNWKNEQRDGGKAYLGDTDTLFRCEGLVPFIHNMADKSWFITEDSIEMVQKRESGNSLMAGILNAAEGVSSGNVKFIIGTNLTSLKDVDEALYRPGRTFDALLFKTLTPLEANGARSAIGLPEVDFGKKDKITLAEALNWEAALKIATLTGRVGF